MLIAVTTTCKKDIHVAGIKLNKISLTLEVDDTETLIATVFPENATNQSFIFTSSNPKVATVTSYGLVTALSKGVTVIEVVTVDGNYAARCTVTVISAKWVKINGVKWAKFNVDMPGTFAANPEDAGMFYQWNRKVGWSSTDPMINSNGGTIWDDTGSEGDSWEKANDPCPTGWRVPTKEELQSLVDADSQWTMVNDVNGRIFGSDDQTLFMPAAGHRCIHLGGNLHYVDTTGYYWSSSIDFSTDAYNLGFSSIFVIFGGSGSRAGFSIRCVKE
jgi:uncharacterized protein (TIGR02145 family)